MLGIMARFSLIVYYSVCNAGYHGLNCDTKCGKCAEGFTTCSAVNGICPNGCDSGWKGPMCIHSKALQYLLINRNFCGCFSTS